MASYLDLVLQPAASEVAGTVLGFVRTTVQGVIESTGDWFTGSSTGDFFLGSSTGNHGTGSSTGDWFSGSAIP
ncbi:hypothetical protein [Nocardia bovistercoris]|uniref:Uncharacterized protein n=1 Tax=Nocardia bovistercoris TaxID=2785916 RepID=A0A931IJ63_9NOCA|nr:hypothetical protein [Nocardia bovistercoris]MBH0780573.1 hypothetical protein [Nocardia bovistercoris]